MTSSNSENLSFPYLYLIFSVAGQVNRRQILDEKIPVVTLDYDGRNFSVVETERDENIQNVLNEIVQNLEVADFYKDLLVAVRLRRIATNSNSV